MDYLLTSFQLVSIDFSGQTKSLPSARKGIGILLCKRRQAYACRGTTLVALWPYRFQQTVDQPLPDSVRRRTRFISLPLLLNEGKIQVEIPMTADNRSGVLAG
ncbi:hypothetical protein [Paenibacillus herberti]|uniref:Uncharacterized protein n=1 Tax=Paenibacillus herberti TaxID=1619309 RepID=A0A229NVH5_9BACL|nr:hypothetical protein [Paenibacillus herberti]OXM13745.1 hypothetical protein CGZ75_22275 [Paenibacillus herberti]